MGPSGRFTSRRGFLKAMAAVAGGAGLPLLAACGQAPATTPQVVEKVVEKPVEVTKVVEKEKVVEKPVEVTKVVEKQVVVTATPAPAPKGPVTLSAALGADDTFWAPQWKLLQQKQPDISIKLTAVPTTSSGWGPYFDKVATLIAGGIPIDMVRIPIEGAKLVVALGIVQPLDDYLKADSLAEAIGDTDPGLLKVFQHRGKIWAIPWDFNDMVIHYNTAHFKEAGLEPPSATWTYDDFLAAATKLTKRSGSQTDRFGLALPTGYHFQSIPWIFNRGASHLSDDWNKATMDDPRFLSGIDFLRDLVWKQKVATVDADPVKMMYTGRASMVGAGRWVLSTYKNNSFSTYDITLWPQGGGAFTEFGVGAQWMMKTTKNPDAVWQVLKFFASKESQAEYHGRGGAIAARKSVALSTPTPAAPPNDKLFYQAFEKAAPKPVPSPPDFNRMEAELLRGYQQTVITNDQPTAAAWAKVQAAVAKVIAERPKDWADL